MHRRRATGGLGVSSLSWGDIDAFVRNSGVRLAPWEVEVVEMIEDLFIAEQARAAKGA